MYVSTSPLDAAMTGTLTDQACLASSHPDSYYTTTLKPFLLPFTLLTQAASRSFEEMISVHKSKIFFIALTFISHVVRPV